MLDTRLVSQFCHDWEIREHFASELTVHIKFFQIASLGHRQIPVGVDRLNKFLEALLTFHFLVLWSKVDVDGLFGENPH